MILREFMQTRASFKSPSPDLYAAFTGDWPPRTASGETINPRTALGVAAYFGAIRAISEDVAKIPCPAYRRLPRRGKEREPAMAVHRIFNVEPNPDMTPMVWRSLTLQHAMGWGNGYSAIEFEPGSTERPRYVWPVDPARVIVQRNKATRAIEYLVTDDDGTAVVIPAWQMFHVHGMGPNGLTGYSIARMARETLGLAMAEEKAGAALFGRGSRPGGILTLARELTKEAHRAFRERWESEYGGAQRNWTTAILGPGMDYKPIAQPNKDAQWIEGRGFSVVEICRWFRMPPNKLAHLDKASYNNIAEENISYVGDTLTAWMAYVEQEAIRKLIPQSQRELFFVEHMVNGLLRGDIEKRNMAYSTARQWGWLSVDDIREFENMNPLPDGQGDMYLVPLNMTTAEAAMQQADEPQPSEQPQEEPSAPAQDNTRGIVRALSPVVFESLLRIARIEEDRLAKAKKKTKSGEKKKKTKSGEKLDQEELYRGLKGILESNLHDAIYPLAGAVAAARFGRLLSADESLTLDMQVQKMAAAYAENARKNGDKLNLEQFCERECDELAAFLDWLFAEFHNGERDRETNN